jgi:hypothetical protein
MVRAGHIGWVGPGGRRQGEGMTRIPELVGFDPGDEARSAVLLLPGGAIKSHGRYWKFVDIALRGLARSLIQAGDPSVVPVVGLAPWLPEGEPVQQLSGRRVLIMHGDRDRTDASAAMSLGYARRARTVVPDLARFEVAGDGHYLLRRPDDCWALATGFVTATTGTRELDPAVAGAMAAEDLRVPL